MNMKYLGIGAIIIIIALVGVTMFLGNSSVERNPDELIVAASGHGGEPESGFDPITGWAYNGEPLVQSSLFRFDNDRNIINDLGTSYQTSDSKVWTVNIRDDVKFSDGTKLTAEDVAFTFNTASKAEGYLFYDSFEKAEAINDTTVQITLSKPQGEFLFTLARQPIVPQDYYDNETYGEKPIGSGPYKLVQWDKGQQAIFELNENYYGEKPEFKKLTILFYENDAAFAAAKKGEVDMAAIPHNYANETVEGMHLERFPSYDSTYITLPFVNNTGNTTEEGNPIGNNITSDASIRKAIYTGMNRQELVDNVLLGYGDVDYTGVDKLPWVNNESKLSDSDVEEAKNILKEAGWKDTNNDGTLDKNGTEAIFNLYYNADNPTDQQMAIALSEQIKEIGININVEGKSSDEIANLRNSNAAISTYGTNDLDPVYSSYLSDRAGQGYSNPGYYNNPTVDNYLNESLSTGDLNETYELVKLAAWDGTTGFGPKGDVGRLFISDKDYLFLVDDSLDIGTPYIQPHGCGDVYGNIYEWTRVNSTN